MPHVDEGGGTLHAYLDGELPSAERDAVEAHLAHCPACRARLTEERALVERASALLGSARPLERPAPPLDQLRRTAPTAPTRRSPWRVRTSFAWAASIALALGLGYVLRGGGRDAGADNVPFAVGYQTQTSRVAEDRPRAAPAPPPHPTAERHQETSLPAPLFAGHQRPSPPALVAAAAEKPRADSAAVSGAGAAAGALALTTVPQLRNATAAPVTRQREADSLVALRRAAADSTASLEEIVVVPQSAVAVRGRATTTQWPIISRGAARNLLGSDPVGLPGLATRRIRRSPAPDGMVVVEQALDSSTVIEIYQRPADSQAFVNGALVRQYERDKAARQAAPPPAAAAAPADRLARYVGRLRVEIAGPLSPDSLNKLLEQVQPLP